MCESCNAGLAVSAVETAIEDAIDNLRKLDTNAVVTVGQLIEALEMIARRAPNAFSRYHD